MKRTVLCPIVFWARAWLKTGMELSSKSGILGALVGDALGVPYEFIPRSQIANSPATDMVGYGTHNQPSGTWSDDSSLILCTVQALTHGYDLKSIATNFVSWFDDGLWTPHGAVFDIGVSTRDVIQRLSSGADPQYSGELDVQSNGNGSLMRILPIMFHLLREENHVIRYDVVAEVSGISHAHVRSKFCCFYYTELARLLFQGEAKWAAVATTNEIFKATLKERRIVEHEAESYGRLLSEHFSDTPESEICSTGYVLHTLEASVWCLLNSGSYPDAVLKAVNLGDDTDTTATVTGGLAGIEYGYEAIPERWVSKIARIDDIRGLVDRFDASIFESQ